MTQLCISLSRSPGTFGTRFHNYLYQELGLDFKYEARACTDLKSALLDVRDSGIRGCGLSMPFKVEALPLLDSVDKAAKEIGAVNTVVNDAGKLKGFNTDFLAVAAALERHSVEPDARIAVLGSGGFARAVLYALSRSGYANLTLVARNPKTGPELLAQYKKSQKKWRLVTSLQDTETFDLLINASPEKTAPFSEELTRQAAAIFDAVIPAPAVVDNTTPWVTLARRLGKLVADGYELTIDQAVEQFSLYTGKRPSAGQVRQAARAALSKT